MKLDLEVLERLRAKYAQSRFEYGWGYQKPTGEAVRFPSYSARQFDPQSWETNFATRQPGTAFRAGYTAEKKVELPPLNAAAIEEDPTPHHRLSGDVGTARVHPGFATPGQAGGGRKVWDGGKWTTEAPMAPPAFQGKDGLPVPRYEAYTPLGQKPHAAGLPTEAPPVAGAPPAGSPLGDAWGKLETKVRSGVMTRDQKSYFEKLVEQHGLSAVQRLYPGALE